MALTKFTGTTTSIQTLPDRPNQTNGFTPAMIKARFDQFATDSKAFYNDVMTVEIDASLLNANTNANTAISTANSANTKADSAVSVASSANTKADSAVSTANSASLSATTAASTSNSALSVANTANSTALVVQTDYNLIKPQLVQAVEDVALKVDKTYVDNLASNFTLGVLPNDILTNAKMANEMKKGIAGGVASYDAVATSLADMTKIPPYAVATGSANTYVVTLTPAITSYIDGMGIVVKINVASTGASTLNIDGKGAKTILDSLGNAITSGGLKANTPYTLRYNGTNFIVQGKGGGGNASTEDLLSGKTATIDSGTITGTMVDRGTVIYTPSTVAQAIANGKHTDSIVQAVNNAIASNIKEGVNIAGVVGTAKVSNPTVGDSVLIADNATYTVNTATPTKVGKRYTINFTGAVRIKYKYGNSYANIAYSIIKKNGVNIGISRSTSAGDFTTIYVEDFFCNAGDYFELFLWNQVTGNSDCASNLFQVCISNVLPSQVTVA